MAESKCNISFYKNDLQRGRLERKICPVKDCVSVTNLVNKHLGKYAILPFCPEHGLINLKDTLAYYNGNSREAKALALKRNLVFNSSFYIKNILRGNIAKPETETLFHESSDKAVIWNVFSELSLWEKSLEDFVALLTRQYYNEPLNLYLWGKRIDLTKNTAPQQYKPLLEVRKLLEPDIKRSLTEPDIIIAIPGKLVISIEAKFGSENTVSENKAKQVKRERPKKMSDIVRRYYRNNEFLRNEVLFDFKHTPEPFYEELFRNIIFASSMAKLEGTAQWYAINLRSQHIIYLNHSLPVQRVMRAFLTPKYRKQFIHFTWEDMYAKLVKGNPNLVNLAWYLKNKTIGARRAFNIIH
jgi:hypothetical protein